MLVLQSHGELGKAAGLLHGACGRCPSLWGGGPCSGPTLHLPRRYLYKYIPTHSFWPSLPLRNHQPKSSDKTSSLPSVGTECTNRTRQPNALLRAPLDRVRTAAPMATPRVIQYVAGSKNNRLPAVYLHCRVKPNASKTREGVTALTDDAVELCVAAVPRDGASNRAVLEVLSKVSFALRTCLQAIVGPAHGCLLSFYLLGYSPLCLFVGTTSTIVSSRSYVAIALVVPKKKKNDRQAC